MEPPFENLEGVISVTSGYTGGKKKNPTYEEVSSGTTGHVEAIQVVYDSTRVSYSEVLDTFWKNIDPLSDDGQFCDKGSQYRAVIFYQNPDQQRLAEASKATWAQSGRFDRPIVTRIVPASTFYEAEAYHQDFHWKDPVGYKSYRDGCGRDKRLRQLWEGAPATP
jgi:peptide-methionine (S)-S-oxide reductase